MQPGNALHCFYIWNNSYLSFKLTRSYRGSKNIVDLKVCLVMSLCFTKQNPKHTNGNCVLEGTIQTAVVYDNLFYSI